MQAFYNFLVGPLAWVTFIVFFGGLIWRFVNLNQIRKQKDAVVGAYLSPKYGLRSVVMWSIPYATRNMRLNPVMTGVAFAFHICLLLAPIFLSAHVILLDMGTLGLSWPTLPDVVADTMTVIVILGACYFVYRRIALPQVAYVTDAKDFALLAVVALPFLTGFLAYHQIFNYQFMIILHILSGEIMLMLIPFTWLAHMILAPMVRAYMGSEFGGVRKVKDW